MILYRVGQLNSPPPRIQINLPVRNFFFCAPHKTQVSRHFLMSFLFIECISGQIRNDVYQTKSRMCMLGQIHDAKNIKILHFEIWELHIWAENGKNLTRP